MPTYIKIILSVVVFSVMSGTHFFQASLGLVENQWIVVGLGLFMVFALWLFPETDSKE